MLIFSSTSLAFAQTVTLTPSVNQQTDNIASGSSVLNSFISGSDWISGGFIFSTPSLLEPTIKLQDGTELTGMSNFRSIFYDIAVPLFVLITSFVAFSHINNDNAVQLQHFFKRLLLIVVLFIVTPAILSYSIQFTNLLNEKIIASNSYNLSTFINSFLDGFIQIPMFRGLLGGVLIVPSWDTVLQLIILIISVGFLLIGFIYIVFQSVIRFIALLIMSIIFPVVLPFALSEKTENIANTYFRTWFSFLIQQPAFVLGFAVVASILTSIAKAHNNSIGTLFVYSGSLIFLGGINVFIGRIFGEGWSLMTTNAQSMIGAHAVNKGAVAIAKNEKVKRIPAYAGKAIGSTAKTLLGSVKKFTDDNKQKVHGNTSETKQKITTVRKELKSQTVKTDSSKASTTAKSDTHTASPIKQDVRGDKKTAYLTNQKEQSTGNQPATPQPSKIATRRENTLKPIAIKRPEISKNASKKSDPIKRTQRKKISI